MTGHEIYGNLYTKYTTPSSCDQVYFSIRYFVMRRTKNIDKTDEKELNMDLSELRAKIDDVDEHI